MFGRNTWFTPRLQLGLTRANAVLSVKLKRNSRRTHLKPRIDLHPTAKPVALVADAILDCTKRDDIVLDPFMGSGTTILAAERTGRRCYGTELDLQYVDTAIRRWQKFTGRQAKTAKG
jgi:DNA modification methylase